MTGAIEGLLGALSRAKLSSAAGCDGRRVRPGDRVAYQVGAGHWIPGWILHLDRSPDGASVAWLLTAAPGLQPIDTVPVLSCLRLGPRTRYSRDGRNGRHR